jgi:hypothetical protein
VPPTSAGSENEPAPGPDPGVLAREQELHGARLEPHQGRTVGVLLRAVLTHDIVGPGAGDEAREHRRDLLPVKLGIVVLIEQPQSDHGRRHPGHAPHLPLGDRVKNVADLIGRHPHQLAVPALPDDVAGLGAVEVVGDPPSDAVELDAVGQGLAFSQRQVLRASAAAAARSGHPPAGAIGIG